MVQGIDEFGAFHFAPRTLKAVGLTSTTAASAQPSSNSVDHPGVMEDEDAALFAGCPPLGEGALVVGDVVLYRLTELSKAWTPCVTFYRSARIISVDGPTTSTEPFQLTLQPTTHAELLRKSARANGAGWKRISTPAPVPRDEDLDEVQTTSSDLLDVRVVEGPSYTMCLQRWRDRQRKEKREAKWLEKLKGRAMGDQMTSDEDHNVTSQIGEEALSAPLSTPSSTAKTVESSFPSSSSLLLLLSCHWWDECSSDLPSTTAEWENRG